MNVLMKIGHHADRLRIPAFLVLGNFGWIGKSLGASNAVGFTVVGIYLTALAIHMFAHDRSPCDLCITRLPFYDADRAARRAWTFQVFHWIMYGWRGIPLRLAIIVAVLSALCIGVELAASGPLWVNGIGWSLFIVAPVAFSYWLNDQHRYLRLWCPTCYPGGGRGDGEPEEVGPRDPSISH